MQDRTKGRRVNFFFCPPSTSVSFQHFSFAAHVVVRTCWVQLEFHRILIQRIFPCNFLLSRFFPNSASAPNSGGDKFFSCYLYLSTFSGTFSWTHETSGHVCIVTRCLDYRLFLFIWIPSHFCMACMMRTLIAHTSAWGHVPMPTFDASASRGEDLLMWTRVARVCKRIPSYYEHRGSAGFSLYWFPVSSQKLLELCY